MWWTDISLLEWGVLAAFLCSLCVFIAKYRAAKKHCQQICDAATTERVSLTNRIAELEKSASVINQAVQPISVAFLGIIIKDLTHFHTPEMDALLLKLAPPISLSKAEINRLTVLLRQRMRQLGKTISPAERNAATMLPMVLKRVEAAMSAEAVLPPGNVPQVQVVTIPDPLHEQVKKKANELKKAEDPTLQVTPIVRKKTTPTTTITTTTTVTKKR